MLLKLNKLVELSTGQKAVGIIVRVFGDAPHPSEGTVFGEFEAWNTKGHQESKLDHSYLQDTDGKRVTNFTYPIPSADLAQVAVDGDFRIIGEHYPTYIKTALSEITGLAITDIEILELV